jgi:sugar phosphate isomerase/epimerase
MVMHSVGVEYNGGKRVGEYERLVDAIRGLASYAEKYGVTLCIENGVAFYREHIRCWADTQESWYQLYRDVDRRNVKLTLDTSHATTNAMRFATLEERLNYIESYISRSEAIARVHWSDSIIGTDEGRDDLHLVPGKGDLPESLHRAIKAFTVPKLLEQDCTEEEIVEGLQFIEGLD